MPLKNSFPRRSAALAAVVTFPAVDGDTLLVGSAAAGFVKKPKFQLIAYSLA